MNFQEIMIRLGVDGSAIGAGLSGVLNRVKSWAFAVKGVISNAFSGTGISNLGQSFGRMISPALNLIPFRAGLGRATAMLRGWLTSTTHEMGHGIGKFFTGFLVFEGLKRGLEHIKEQIIEINRLSEETGASTNFIQSMMLEAKISGVQLESLMMPITRFNTLIGRAKMGHVDAILKLQEMGLASSKGAISALNYESAMKKLKESFDKAGNPAKQDAILFDAFGRGAYKLAPIFRQTNEEFNKMFKGNSFTKINLGAIEDFLSIWKAIKVAAQSAWATIINVLDLPLKGYREISKFIGAIAGGAKSWGAINKVMNDSGEKEKELTAEKELSNQADEDGISLQKEKLEVQNKYLTLLEKQAELQAEIADRDKESVKELAEKARHLTGIKSPLQQSHTVTARMRTALKIDTLEERAKLEFERGHDEKSRRLQSEADQIRAASPWMKRQDRNPMAKTESELATVNSNLAPVKRMAELVNSQK